jgi:serine/threonine protein kinase
MSSESFERLPMQFGRYRVEKFLGKGTMGAVYLAQDQQLERRVALKVARVSASGSARLIKRMETEAKAAAKIDHPLICKVFDFGEIDGIRFIALQYIEGEDLKTYLKRVGRRREPDEALGLIRQMLRALAEAHQQEVIHRDLKPENVMLNRAGEPVIMDFGLARRTTGSSDAGLTQGMILGTAAYMSPEQAIGKADGIDHRCDQYAVGVMLFEMLTGDWPFTGGAVEVMGKKCVQQPQSPLELNPDVPRQLAAVCHKMIAKRKEDRYVTCNEAFAALEAIDLTSPQQGVSGTEPTRRQANVSTEPDPCLNLLKSLSNDPTKKSPRLSQQKKGQKTAPPGPLVRLSGWWNSQSSAVRWMGIGGFVAGLLLLTYLCLFPTSSVKSGGTTIAKQNGVETADTAMASPVSTDKARFHGASAGESKELVAGIKFRWCPAGNFTMGTPGATDDESPVEVTLTQGFWLAETELTQGQWQKVMGTAPWNGMGELMEGDDFPATFVSHDDAVAFCQKLTSGERAAGQMPTDWMYILPTEAQWEYGCRAGTTTKYSFGENGSQLGEYAWFDKNTKLAGEVYAHRVGKKESNAWGLRDMHGNVWEWCSDWYGEKLPGGRDPVGILQGSFRVLRGGSWRADDARCRSANRPEGSPGDRYNNWGFRVAAVSFSE